MPEYPKFPVQPHRPLPAVAVEVLGLIFTVALGTQHPVQCPSGFKPCKYPWATPQILQVPRTPRDSQRVDKVAGAWESSGGAAQASFLGPHIPDTISSFSSPSSCGQLPWPQPTQSRVAWEENLVRSADWVQVQLSLRQLFSVEPWTGASQLQACVLMCKWRYLDGDR